MTKRPAPRVAMLTSASLLARVSSWRRSASICHRLRECAGRNASERRASLEKDNAQADPTTLSGKADTAGVNERSSTPSRCAGVVATACTQGKRTKHGKPQSVVSDDQPEAREGQAGRLGVAERFVVLLKPGNAGGGKGSQFKADAIRGEGPGDWATYQLRECSETAEGVARESKGVKSCPRAGCGRSACPVVRPAKAGMFSRR